LVATGVLVADLGTKAAVQWQLQLHELVPLLGDYVRLTLLYNPGAAFGISVGEHSRVVFLALTVVALAVMVAMVRATPLAHRLRHLALSLVAGGALGNLWNRIANPRGVTDWIDVGVGAARWPAFNVADAAITTGAILLVVSLSRDEE
jgi:signal peptidase II